MKSLFLIKALMFTVCIDTSSPIKIYTIADGLPSNQVRSLHIDNEGKVWIGTPKGSAILENGGVHANMVVKNGVPSILRDSQGRVWFGGIGEVYLYENGSYHKYSLADDLGLDARVVFSIYEDAYGKVWLASSGGSISYYKDEWKDRITQESGIKNQVIHDVMQEGKKRYWFATRKGGLNILDGKDWESLLPEKNCRKFLKDRFGNIWIGTSTGIVKYDGNDFRAYEEDRTLLPMFQGSDDQIWCITDTREVVKIAQDGSPTVYDDLSDGKASVIYTLANINQHIYAGTDIGLLVLKWSE